MRSSALRRGLGVSALALVLLPQAFADDLRVVVKGAGKPLSGATVCACSIAPNGPDPALSRLAASDNTGTARFSGLSPTIRYEVLVGAQGWAPGMHAQYDDPKHPFIVPDGTLQSAAVALKALKNVGEIDAAVTGATPRGVVFADVFEADGALVADGMGFADDSGGATVKVLNVPAAKADKYTLSAYDLASHKTAAAGLDQALSAQGLLAYPLNLAAAAADQKRAAARSQGLAYAGRGISLFATPNPFSLGLKVPALKQFPAKWAATNGTFFTLQLPAKMGGEGRLKIYTRSGELVRELALGELAGGADYLVEWDGKAANNVGVPGGFYYAIFSIAGTNFTESLKVTVVSPPRRAPAIRRRLP